MDCIFQVDGQKAMVAISCAAIAALREHEGRHLSDQQLADIAALHLRRTVQAGYDPTTAELFVGKNELRALAQKLGYL
jgi:hypothetical protein